jgi:Fe-S-cluster containining protein
MVRLEGANPYEFLEFLTPDEITGVEPDDPTWLKVGDERYVMALRRGAKGCHFLDKKTRYCTIYDARPILCRLYPFALQETEDGEYLGFELHDDVGCPKNLDGEHKTQPLHELYLDDSLHQEDYGDLVAVFNARKDKDKSPEDFVQMFVHYEKNMTTV